MKQTHLVCKGLYSAALRKDPMGSYITLGSLVNTVLAPFTEVLIENFMSHCEEVQSLISFPHFC